MLRIRGAYFAALYAPMASSFHKGLMEPVRVSLSEAGKVSADEQCGAYLALP
jgi:hypothetical protein